MKVRIKKLCTEAIIPAYQSDEAAGFDLHSVEELTLKKGERRAVKTGLAMQIDKGYELQVRARSGLALKHGIALVNAPGTVDSDYRGEIMVILVNLGDEDFSIKIGDRIAQAVLKEVVQAEIFEVEELEDSSRGKGGFGSTGK
ncbi:MAG: dUTP diphosphatase [Campylobacterales bacterium]